MKYLMLMFSCAFLVWLGLRCTRNKNLPVQIENEDAFSQSITVQEAKAVIDENMDNTHFILLDVRSASEFQSGHIKNAVNINISEMDFLARVSEYEKNSTLLIYCRSGNRSATAMNQMKKAGFAYLYNMLGGISAWQNAGYPVVID